jgi:hypothetical protein
MYVPGLSLAIISNSKREVFVHTVSSLAKIEAASVDGASKHCQFSERCPRADSSFSFQVLTFSILVGWLSCVRALKVGAGVGLFKAMLAGEWRSRSIPGRSA